MDTKNVLKAGNTFLIKKYRTEGFQKNIRTQYTC